MNQPTGYRPTGVGRPSYYYGRRHEYIYYPVAWTDTSTGTAYKKGYYDENGQLYEDVAFEKNGKYENVVCHCPYCGQDTVMNLDADKVGTQSLQCPHCSGPMEIKSQLDEAVSGAAEAAVSADRESAVKKRKRRRWVTFLVIILLLWALTAIGERLQKEEQGAMGSSIQQIQSADDSNVSLFGRTVSLVRTGNGGYEIVTDGRTPDRQLEWDDYEESYYDAESDCWLWYNTEVDPPVWQYWYEGISSDFGDYGWMEHDDTGWYIEASYGNWIPLPAKYDAGALWYIAE